MIDSICRNCGKPFRGRNGSTSCSRLCAVTSRDQSGAKNPKWKGGNITPAMKGQRYRTKYPEKDIAHRTVTNAVRNGLLMKAPCEVCGNEGSQAHHEDYNKPFEVIWLCKGCHLSLHTS